MNHSSQMPAILVTLEDQQKLTGLALDAMQGGAPEMAADLLAEIERARVVDVVPPSVVQMGSRVTFAADGRERTVVLVYPGQADIDSGRISILTPIGTALIGLSVGQSIEWSTRDGRRRRLTVLDVQAEEKESAS